MRKLLGSVGVIGLILATLTALASPASAEPPTPTVTGISLATSAAKVYPHKDGYLDSVRITASAVTSDSSVVNWPGELLITKATTGSVVTHWKISSAQPAAETWNGRVHNKVVSGSYIVTVRYMSPSGDWTVQTTTPIAVSHKRLVKHTWTKKGAAYPSMTSCSSCYYDSILKTLPPTHKHGVTVFQVVNGIRYWGVQPTVDLSNGGAVHSVKLPAGFASSVKSSAYVRARVTLSGAKGHRFYLEACGSAVSTSESDVCTVPKSVSKTATITSSKVTLQPGSIRASWLAGSSLAANAVVATYTVHVTYYTLK